MTNHYLRFSPKLWLGMAAATGLTLTMSTPANAETIDLICHYPSGNSDRDMHVYIDPDRQTVVNTVDDKRFGPLAASISGTLFHWTERIGDWEHQYTIDRVAGSLRYIRIWRGELQSDVRGQCRRATQKF